MLTHADLPGCTSSTHDAPTQLSTTSISRRLPLSRRLLVKALLGVGVPAALLSTALPAARPAAQIRHAPAAVFALAGTTAAFVGDAGLADADAAVAELGTFEGTLDFGAPADKQTTGKITSDAANIRSGPGIGYNKIGKLFNGAVVTIIESNNDWHKVRTAKGSTGWVSQEAMAVETGTGTIAAPAKGTPAKPAAAPAAAIATDPVATVALRRINLRQGPATACSAIAQLARGNRLTLLARHGDWFKIRTSKGVTGWVSGDVINASAATIKRVAVTNNVPAAPKKQAAAKPAAGVSERSIPGSSRGATAARVALRYVGARYVWGGASPRGFDCSGLVLYAYRQAGLKLPHKASLQFSTRYGTRIRSVGALKTGDIVFFANTAGRGITHVAIYVGNGRMVTANSPRTGVRLQSINTRYWRSHFAGAIRPRG